MSSAEVPPPMGGAEVSQAEGAIGAEDVMPVPPVTIHLPSSTHPKTLPKSHPGYGTTLTLLPQPHETVQELKLTINESVVGYWLGPYSLRLPASAAVPAKKEGVDVRAGERLSEWLETGDVFPDAEGERVLEVVREPYSDFTARQTVLRLLDSIAPAGSSTHTLTTSLGVNPGATIYDSVRSGEASSSRLVNGESEASPPSSRKKGKKELVKVKRDVDTSNENPFADWDGTRLPLSRLPSDSPTSDALPCLKDISLSPLNPPPPHLRQQGHLLYLSITLLEGDSVTLAGTSRGWFVSRTSQIDPPTRDANIYHSVFDLLHSLSPLFTQRISLLPPLSTSAPLIEPISTVPIPQAMPAYPWITSSPQPQAVDIVRTQLAYLHSGAMTADALDGARDWNEEIQGAKELPKTSMAERIVREKMAQKIWSEFTQASVRSVMTVARGDLPPLNPNEEPRAHMWLTSNIFITKAIDSIDTYSHLGGDEAAHVSHSKDAAGVRLLNKLDVEGVHLLGHTVIDWQGDRWVCQSMLPGIFSRRKEDDEVVEARETDKLMTNGDGDQTKSKSNGDWVKVHSTQKSTDSVETQSKLEDELVENPLIIYGLDSEQLTSIHWDAPTHRAMKRVAEGLHLAEHYVSDGKDEQPFWASAEVKALRGTDGRRYLLDLPRLSPVDVEWLEKDMTMDGEGPDYPHRMVLLRPELIETYWESELKRWAKEVASKSKGDEASRAITDNVNSASARGENSVVANGDEQESSSRAFDLHFNNDAFVDLPQPRKSPSTETSIKSSMRATDESTQSIKAVREASSFLRTIAIPAFVIDVLAGHVSSVIDGCSLSKQMHQRGINIRYLGHLANTVEQFAAKTGLDEDAPNGQLKVFGELVRQEMIYRACKHLIWRYIRGLEPEHVPCAISHFLNCLLSSSNGATYEPFDLDPRPEPAFVKLTSSFLRDEISHEVRKRYRFDIHTALDHICKPELLRELAMRVGFQLLQREYDFDTPAARIANGVTGDDDKLVNGSTQANFSPADILCIVPLVRSTAPTATVAEEVLEAARATINRGSLDVGLEFLLESVQLYESVHAILHPEVAAAYNTYGITTHQLARVKIQQAQQANADAEALASDAPTAGKAGEAQTNGDIQSDPSVKLDIDVSTAVRLQRQAVIIAERTLGVWHADTLNYYHTLAMLESLEGNVVQGLRYFKHVLDMWSVLHSGDHPEVATVLVNAASLLQSIPDHPTAHRLLTAAHGLLSRTLGPTHMQTAQTHYQLMHAQFLIGQIPTALASAESVLSVYTSRLGPDHSTTVDVSKNVEILKTIVDGMQSVNGTSPRSHARSTSSTDRIAAMRQRLGIAATPRVALTHGVTPAVTVAKEDRDVDELVRFIQGGSASPAPQADTQKKRGKNALRGKRRTGAKR